MTIKTSKHFILETKVNIVFFHRSKGFKIDQESWSKNGIRQRLKGNISSSYFDQKVSPIKMKNSSRKPPVNPTNLNNFCKNQQDSIN